MDWAGRLAAASLGFYAKALKASGIVTPFPGCAQEGLCCYGSVCEGLGSVEFGRFSSLLWSLLASRLAFASMTFRALRGKTSGKDEFF